MCDFGAGKFHFDGEISTDHDEQTTEQTTLTTHGPIARHCSRAPPSCPEMGIIPRSLAWGAGDACQKIVNSITSGQSRNTSFASENIYVNAPLIDNPNTSTSQPKHLIPLIST